MKRFLSRWRWNIANSLSKLACLLRGHRIYRSDTWAGTTGNRAAHLKQSIWERVCILDITGTDGLGEIDSELTELAKLAGENWWHE